MTAGLVKIKLRFTGDVPVEQRREYVQAMKKLGAGRVGNSFSFLIEENILREALGLEARSGGSMPSHTRKAAKGQET